MVQKRRYENLRQLTKAFENTRIALDGRTEQNNIFIDLIGYSSSSYIHSLHTFIRESTKCESTKKKKKKKQTNKIDKESKARQCSCENTI